MRTRLDNHRDRASFVVVLVIGVCAKVGWAKTRFSIPRTLPTAKLYSVDVTDRPEHVHYDDWRPSGQSDICVTR